MNPFLLWMRRRTLLVLLLVLLLSVGTAASSVGVSAYLAANRQTEAAAQAYTTVAIPYDPEFLGRTPVESSSYQQSPPIRYYDLDAILSDAPIALQACPAVPLLAVIPDSIPLKASDFDTAVSGYGMPEAHIECGVAVLRCDRIVDSSEEREYFISDETGRQVGSYTQKIIHYQYLCTVVEPLCLPAPSESQLPIKDSVMIDTNICQPDGSPYFEKGKTYIVWGRYSLLSKIGGSFIVGDDPNHLVSDEPSLVTLFCNGVEQHENGISESQKVLWAISADDAPLAAEITGSVEDFLDSEEGKSWRDLIDATEGNHHSMKLLATDAVESLAPFCTRYNDLLEGRFYTAEEARSGAKVCLVSAAWAEKNGAKVGDVLPISIYAPQYRVIQFVGDSGQWPALAGPETDQAQLFPMPAYPEDATGQGGDYEIIGIYTCPPPGSGSLRFDPDTMLIPMSSMEHAEQYITEEMTHYPLLNAYLLPNGAQKALEDWLTEKGLGGRFLYYDYGYSVAEDAIAQMRENGTRLFIGGIVILLLSLAMFALLLRLLLSRTARFMRLLGQSPKAIRTSFSRTVPLWTVPAVLLGGLLCRLGYSWVTGRLLSAALTFDWRIAGLAALAQAAVICPALLLIGTRVSEVRLMRGGLQ